MTETLEGALAPLFTFGSFFGLGMFEYPRGQPRAYLSCLYVLVKWGFLMFFYYSLYFIMSNDKIYVSQITELVLVNLLILISFCRFKVTIFKCTPDLYMIIFNFILLIFLFNNIYY